MSAWCTIRALYVAAQTEEVGEDEFRHAEARTPPGCCRYRNTFVLA
jgi:hypothetical protein